jgi:hypothetical protein
MDAIHVYSIISDEQPIAATVTETLLQLVTPSTREAALMGFTLSAKSVVAGDVPMLVEILLQTTAGTSSGVTPAPYKRTNLPASLCTGCLKSFSGTEPTASTILRRFYETPVGGLIVYHFPEGQEIQIPVSTRLALRVTSPQNETVVAEMFFAE